MIVAIAIAIVVGAALVGLCSYHVLRRWRRARG